MVIKRRILFILCGLLVILLSVELSLYALFQLGKRFYLRASKEINIDSSTQRILCLGDSFTYGVGADRDYSYPVQLEKLLNYNSPEKKFKVFYYGINALSSSMVANTLSNYIKKYRPNILIILTGCSDHWNLRQSNLSEVTRGRKINERFLKVKVFLYNFRTFRLMQMAINEIISKVRDIKKDEPGIMKFSNITDDNLYRNLIEYNYTKIIQIVSNSGGRIKLFFQTYPTGPERINKIIKAVALNYKIPMIEQDVIFSKLKKIKPFVACDEWHLNARGYNLMAKNVYEEFLKEGIIDDKLTRDIEMREKEVRNEIVRFNENTWEFDLAKIAQHPEKLIINRENSWCLIANNIVDLPEIELMPGEYILQIQAKGTAVEGIYPLVGFYYKIEGMDGKLERNELSKIYVDADWRNYSSKKVMINNKQNCTFYISFENDKYIIKDGIASDRNLYVRKIILNSLSK